MSRQNKKVWPVAMVLVMAALLGASLLRANDEKAGQAGDSEPAKKKSQEDVLEQLLDEGSSRPMIITRDIPDEVRVPIVEPVDPKAKMPLLVREGDVVINRMGRLGKDRKGTLLFVYEADGRSLSEPPLILLPSLKLEQMERLASKKGDAKFMVSGEVTVYHGKGYLLLRKVMLYQDLGQF